MVVLFLIWEHLFAKEVCYLSIFQVLILHNIPFGNLISKQTVQAFCKLLHDFVFNHVGIVYNSNCNSKTNHQNVF